MFETPGVLDPAVRAAYLSRLGVEAGAPTPDMLKRVVQRQVERVPYETFWIPAGERWSTDPARAAQRIAFDRRGGYCYHLNGALGLLLSSLGYAVHGHVGAVQTDEPNPNAMGNHLVLTVSDLPADTNPSGNWYVDAGLGDALHEPLPLTPGTYVQEPFQLALADEPDQHGWTLTHDPAGGFRSMTWTTGPASASDFVAQHEWLSTSPESGFVRVPMAERRDATGVDVIRGVVLARVGAKAFTSEPITDQSDWFEVLAEIFDLRFDAASAEWRERLWNAVLGAHRAWEASQR